MIITSHHRFIQGIACFHQMMKFKGHILQNHQELVPYQEEKKIDFIGCIACSSLAMSTVGASIHRHVILFYSWDHPTWCEKMVKQEKKIPTLRLLVQFKKNQYTGA
uniref:Uncharacterized protein n=1 Tax=Opuntia streptacantha TaxID=393608 RepID=A0A7C8YN71_OPUST